MNHFDREPERSFQPGENSRRNFLARVAVVGLGAAAMSLGGRAHATTYPDQPAADAGHDYPLTKIYPTTGKEFGTGIIGLVTVSNIISGIGVDRATNAVVKEFANFELRETITVLSILKGAGTSTPPLNATLKGILSKVSAAQAPDFDKAYIGAQLAGHEWLRDTAEIYLENSADHTSAAEKHSRDVVMLSLAFFKEHVVLAKNIVAELGS